MTWCVISDISNPVKHSIRSVVLLFSLGWLTVLASSCGSHQASCPMGYMEDASNQCVSVNGAGMGSCTMGFTYTTYGCLPQGSCPIGYGDNNGQCIAASNNGYGNGYGGYNNGGNNNGYNNGYANGGYNNGYNNGYGNGGYNNGYNNGYGNGGYNNGYGNGNGCPNGQRYWNGTCVR